MYYKQSRRTTIKQPKEQKEVQPLPPPLIICIFEANPTTTIIIIIMGRRSSLAGLGPGLLFSFFFPGQQTNEQASKMLHDPI